jgi:hypothetical protein
MPKAQLAELYRSLALAMACPQDTGVRLTNSALYVDCGILQAVRGGGALKGLVRNGATLLAARPPRRAGAVKSSKPRSAAHSRRQSARARGAGRH